MYSAISCRFSVWHPKTKNSSYPCAKLCRFSQFTDILLLGADFISSAFLCRFSEWQPRTKKSTYPYVNDCRLSQITYVLLVVDDKQTNIPFNPRIRNVFNFQNSKCVKITLHFFLVTSPFIALNIFRYSICPLV